MRKHCHLNTDISTEDIQYIGDKICNMSIAFTDSEQVKVQQRQRNTELLICKKPCTFVVMQMQYCTDYEFSIQAVLPSCDL